MLKLRPTFIYCFLLVASFMFVFTEKSSANYMDTSGIIIAPGTKYIDIKVPDSNWLRFAQSVNSNQQNVYSWTGYPFSAIMNHITALVVGYPDIQGRPPINRGALYVLNNLTGALYTNKPASSITYLADLSNSIGLNFSPQVYASAGTDFFPAEIKKMWAGVRDVAFVFYIAIFVVIGFMIMFRFKINPQTTASVQNSLPNIVVSLITVSLSYAIIGLAIDLVFVGNKLIEYIFVFNNLVVGGNAAEKADIFGLLSGTWGGQDITKLAWKLFTDLIKFDPAGLLAFLTIMILITSTVGIFMALLSKYVTLLLSTIFAPIVFMFGALPGKSDTITKFIKSIFVAALSFPAVYLFLTISSYLGGTASPTLLPLPPLDLPIGAKDSIVKLVALGILMITPKIPDTLSEAFEVRGGLGAGSQEIGGFLRRIPIIGSLLG